MTERSQLRALQLLPPACNTGKECFLQDFRPQRTKAQSLNQRAGRSQYCKDLLLFIGQAADGLCIRSTMSPLENPPDTYPGGPAQPLPRSLLQFCHTHVGHQNSERNRGREIKQSLLTLGRGSWINFYEAGFILWNRFWHARSLFTAARCS